MVPKLRFSEFNTPWKQVSLGEVCADAAYGMNSAATAFDGSNKYIRITDIDDESREFSPSPLTSPSGTLDNKYLLRDGDIVFARTGASVGKSYLYKKNDGKLYFAGFLIRLSIKKANPCFVYNQTLTRKYRKWVKIYSMRSGQPGINAEEYKEFDFAIPSSEEQNKIADFLSSIEERIALMNKQYNLLCQYKKGMMQKIFSQELRFKDDRGEAFPEWDKQKLGDVAIFLKGKGVAKTDIIEYGERECIRYGELYTDYGEVINKIKSRTNQPLSDSILSVSHDVLIPSSGETAIDISKASCVLSDGVILGGDLNVIRSKLIDGIFLSYYINSQKKYEIAQIAQGNSVVHLYAKQLAKIEIFYPCKTEQIKIASFLSAIDEKIAATKKVMDKLKTWKQGLLQQMFA
ncbi:restriction endonuclease subunit S [Klebsiella variicola]|uniref:restriction endonuclease subunit S n=1 Tax=Klebsiella variicola TaxID=244366 RepID=UPI00344D0418